jgi:hypothetical protein
MPGYGDLPFAISQPVIALLGSDTLTQLWVFTMVLRNIGSFPVDLSASSLKRSSHAALWLSHCLIDKAEQAA